MGLPKKKNLNLNSTKKGNDRVKEIFDLATDNTNFLPKSIITEDIDIAMFDTFTNEMVRARTPEGDVIPTFYMTKEKWADFLNTWKSQDESENDESQGMKMPFITLRRISSPKRGNNEIYLSRIAQNKKFNYYRVPTFEDGIMGFDMYKVPQPIPIEMDYELKLFTHYLVDVNNYNEIIIELFASLQCYMLVNGYYIEIKLKDSIPEGTMDDFNSHNFYQETTKFTVNGFLLKPETFERTRSIRNINLKF